MTGIEILKAFYKLLHQHYNLNIADFDVQVDSFWDNDDIIDELKNHVKIQNMPKIHELLDVFREVTVGSDYLGDVFNPSHKIELIDFSSNSFKKRKRAFSYSDSDFGYLASSKLFKSTPLSTINSASVDYRVLIDYISNAIIIASQNGKLTKLLSIIKSSNKDWGILIYKIPNNNSKLSIYSYLYYKDLLQGNKVDLDSDLNYSPSHGATATFSPTTKYEQYFEVYDIINELNHATDTVTRFLKLYHIIEYLVYRRELVEIEQKARNNRTFIREIHSLSGKGSSSSEMNILKNNFKKIFENEIIAGGFNFPAPLNPLEIDFLKKNWEINNFNQKEPNHIATLIYRIRNSIVHNKESEFHITTSNPDDYKDVLNLIKQFINILERNILNKISNNDVSISYQNQHIQLY